MGQTGRKKLPTNLRLLRGETRPSQIGRGEPVPRPGEPEPPRARWFGKRHREVWARVCGELRAMGLLHSADRDVLLAYVCAVVQMEQAAQAVAAGGLLVRGRDGATVRNPAVFAWQSAADTVRRTAREFGLTPGGRADLRHVYRPPDGSGPERLLS